MQDTRYCKNLGILQASINNLMLMSDTSQRELLLDCLKVASKQVREGTNVTFQKPMSKYMVRS